MLSSSCHRPGPIRCRVLECLLKKSARDRTGCNRITRAHTRDSHRRRRSLLTWSCGSTGAAGSTSVISVRVYYRWSEATPHFGGTRSTCGKLSDGLIQSDEIALDHLQPSNATCLDWSVRPTGHARPNRFIAKDLRNPWGISWRSRGPRARTGLCGKSTGLLCGVNMITLRRTNM